MKRTWSNYTATSISLHSLSSLPQFNKRVLCSVHVERVLVGNECVILLLSKSCNRICKKFFSTEHSFYSPDTTLIPVCGASNRTSVAEHLSGHDTNCNAAKMLFLLEIPTLNNCSTSNTNFECRITLNEHWDNTEIVEMIEHFSTQAVPINSHFTQKWLLYLSKEKDAYHSVIFRKTALWLSTETYNQKGTFHSEMRLIVSWICSIIMDFNICFSSKRYFLFIVLLL